ncbi:hypothetical protein CLV58_10616 [Spirosoma oryzae]|uniref:Uncharacterized protein n=1 Tax=Spirosoma oryzae TaxID=1469603 RepID=A0A2T0T5C2_9BACT|nr:hypothetical protein [Spirosoma oryzae]PRY40833.1 hypothetical protein CLV58_10616 [Spirosoma oryzae]
MKTVDQILSECLSSHSWQVLNNQHESDMRGEVEAAMRAYYNQHMAPIPPIDLFDVTNGQWQTAWNLALGNYVKGQVDQEQSKLDCDMPFGKKGTRRVKLKLAEYEMHVYENGFIDCFTEHKDEYSGDSMYDSVPFDAGSVVHYLRSLGLKAF